MTTKKKTKKKPGPKGLVPNETTVRTGLCMSRPQFERLCEEGEKSGKGFSHHIRLACAEKYPPRKKRRKK